MSEDVTFFFFLAPKLKMKHSLRMLQKGHKMLQVHEFCFFFPLDRQKDKHHLFAFGDILLGGEPYELLARDVGIVRTEEKQTETNCCSIRGSFPAKQTSSWRTSAG